MTTPIFDTQRLILRPFSYNDIDEVYDCWLCDEEVSKYMYWKSMNLIKEAKDFFDYEISMINNDKWYRWLITDKLTGKIYGTCLIYFNDEENAWDISYNLGRKFWGKGYITEAMKKVIDFGFGKLNIKEFIAAHAIENSASSKVIEKLGFKYEKDIPYCCNGGEIHTTGKFYRLKNNI